MTKLSAKKTVQLDPSLMISKTESECLNLEQSIDGYDVSIEFVINTEGGAKINTETGVETRPVHKIVIIASKEVESTPDIPLSETGGRDFTTLRPYFDEKQREYSPIIGKVFKNLLLFFKYRLNQPFLDPTYFKNNKFHDTEWFDDSGHEYGSLTLTLDGRIPFGPNWDQLGVKSYDISEASELKEVLITGYEEELQYQLLSDAQSAILGSNLRRGIFETAVACELSVKRTFFSKQSFSGDAFEYLEDKGKVKVTILEFITSVAKEVFGESFKERFPEDYKNIDYLIRCRNKIAHRGELVFKDDSATIHEADLEFAKKWYCSARVLLSWLEEAVE